MSEIDQYKHKCIGIIACPSSCELIKGTNKRQEIPLYQLNENTPEWGAKSGDLLLGGGSGESAALRISLPEAILWLTQETWDEFDSFDAVYKAYWSATEAYVFGEGYIKQGWHPQQPIEFWLIEHIVAFILQAYPETYANYCGTVPLEKDGSICRVPNSNSIEANL